MGTHDVVSVTRVIIGDHYDASVPPGWEYAVFSDEIVLLDEGKHSRILIRPHPFSELGELDLEMHRLPDLWDFRLETAGDLETISENAIAINLNGTRAEQPTWVRLIATLSPFGGGAFILATTGSIDDFGEVAKAADIVATGMTYRKGDVSQLMDYLSDMYEDHQGTQMLLLRNGVFARKSQGGYIASAETPYDEVIPAWGIAAGRNPFGTWTAIGNRKEGTIIATCEDASRESISYRVVEESRGKPLVIKLNGRQFRPIPGYHRKGIMDWIRLLPRQPKLSGIR